MPVALAGTALKTAPEEVVGDNVKPHIGRGSAVGDIDNDGDQDVFLCNYGPNVLFRNNGDGTFKDVSHAAGLVSMPSCCSPRLR